jgi:Fe-S cluster assembly ATP-binding protein
MEYEIYCWRGRRFFISAASAGVVIVEMLEVENLRLAVGEKTVLDGLSLALRPGEIHALLGKNGVGKSSLARAIAGCPGYEISNGRIAVDGEDVAGKTPDEVAAMGVFLAFQNPVEIPGVSVANFLRAAIQAKFHGGTPFNAIEFYGHLHGAMDSLKIPRDFTARPINDGFSGGEKKRCEVLQLLMLRPKYAILDEIDSGLDVDAVGTIAGAIASLRGPQFAALIISHHSRLLELINPDRVHLLSAGRIVASGGMELVARIESLGYEAVEGELGHHG